MRIKEGCKVRSVAGEHLILLQGVCGLQATRVIVLNDAGAWLFDKVKNSIFTKEELVSVMIQRYKVDFHIASQDVEKWVDQLTISGVIENSSL